MSEETLVLLDEAAVRRALSRMAHEILERHRTVDEIVLVGIRSRGVQLAGRVAEKIGELTGHRVAVGSIDIAPYRDDVQQPRDRIEESSAHVAEPIDGRAVVLVDDVLATGRTIRAALDVLTGLGRPREISAAVLIDRGDREVPIKADYVGHNVSPGEPRRVNVRVRELDGRDEVTLR